MKARHKIYFQPDLFPLQFNFDLGQDLLQHIRLQHWPDTLHVQLLCHPHLLLLLLRLLRLPPTRQHHLQHLLPILLLLLGHPNHPSNRPPQLPFLLRLPLLFSPAMYRPHYKVKQLMVIWCTMGPAKMDRSYKLCCNLSIYYCIF